MARRIYKYALEVVDAQVVQMPAGALLHSVQLQGGTPCVWAQVDDTAPLVPRLIRCYGTGQPMADGPQTFLDTIQMAGGSLVFHFFDAGVAEQ